MSWSIVVRLIVGGLAVMVIGLVGFVGLIMTSLGGSLFYSVFIGVAAIGLSLLVIARLIPKIPLKGLRIASGLFAAGLLISVAVHEGLQAYENRFAVVKEGQVDLRAYEPFAEGTKAAKLHERSKLSLSGELPRLDGATALYPLYAAFAQAAYPAGTYPAYGGDTLITSSGTATAYERLMDGEADMIFAAAPSEQQLAMAKRKGVELELTPVGREAFVFFVQADNPVKGLKLADIRRIYSGEVTNWQEVGGKNAAIRAFQRPENSGSQTMLQRVMKDYRLMTPPKETVAEAMAGIIEQTADYRNYSIALGFSFLFYATQMVGNGEIRLLEVDGVEPNRDTIASGAYPLAADFYAVMAGTSNPNARALLDWIRSKQGQELVEATGYTRTAEAR
ncbi:PstS family phosphate ABC transporter substrate-binding protein [Paenibacillus xanthanilyticus]|uniref:PstS family phosphate ABC transporter substrate-binding protein n=1 Tax=Paenibacillus xanthanilyticus TaxID=1783531 RepID=A0ABV8K271_9BACL